MNPRHVCAKWLFAIAGKIPALLYIAFVSLNGGAGAEEILSPSVKHPLPARTAQEEIAWQIDEFSQRFRQGWNAGLWEAVAPLYAQNALMLPPGKKIISGSDAILGLYRATHQSGMIFQILKNQPTRIWTSGDLVITAGEAVMAYTAGRSMNAVSEYSKVLDVWTRRPDGSLGLAIDAWVADPNPGGGKNPDRKPEAIPCEAIDAGAATDTAALQSIYAQVRAKETEFKQRHAKNPVAAAETYAPDALLITAAGETLDGIEAIRQRAQNQKQISPGLNPGSQVLAIGGTAGLVYVINLFGDQAQSRPGKGVRVWKRAGADWVVAADFYNDDVPGDPKRR